MLGEIVVSTIVPLVGLAAWTSARFTMDAHDEIAISCYSDVAGSLAVQQSNDGTNYDVLRTIPYIAAAQTAIAVPITAKYGRLVYTNGVGAQAAFRLFAAKKKGVDHTAQLNDIGSTLGLTTFGIETVAATAVNGVTWKDLLDKSVITGPTEIWGFQVTEGGVWAGTSKLRITTGAGTKIWPFAAEAVEGTDYVDAVDVEFPAPVCVPVASGYKIQFRSSNAGDGAGETLALTALYVVTRS